METDNKNRQNSLPYEKLALLGIDREKADRLPEDFKRRLADGEVTPLMQVSITARNGNVITLPLKLQMALDHSGQTVLIAYPVRKALDEEKTRELRLTTNEVERLRKGDVIQKAVDANGEKTQHYLQLDPETKSIIRRKVNDIKVEQRVRDMEKVNHIEFGTQQKQQVRDGKPAELNVGGEKVTVGIDLKEPQGFRIVKGDMKEWERQQKLRYDDLQPEYIGLVQTDKNTWEYRKVVERYESERAINLDSDRKRDRNSGMKM
ncbi:DUF4099 domain-containing protein [uncultured Duncaniella sp.]|nr:DUF4099 domain-containing protein [uncultured Duncaniella sp.]